MENSMEQRIEEQLDGLSKEEIVELNLDNCKTSQIEGLTDEFKNLACLSVINCGLTTLKGLPNLPELRRLELSDNRLSGTLNLLVTACPKLTHLHLGGNKIKELEALETLKELVDLRKLDLLNCEVTEVEGYREKVFEMLPQIIYLDGLNADNEEDDDDDDEDDEDEEGEEEEGDEDEEDEEVGLSYLQKSGLEEESDGEDFQPNGTNDDDDDEDDEEEEEEMEDELAGGDGDEEGEKKSPAVPRGRGVKRKRGAEDDNGAVDSESNGKQVDNNQENETNNSEENVTNNAE